jgi:hypothetical protein
MYESAVLTMNDTASSRPTRPSYHATSQHRSETREMSSFPPNPPSTIRISRGIPGLAGRGVKAAARGAGVRDNLYDRGEDSGRDVLDDGPRSLSDDLWNHVLRYVRSDVQDCGSDNSAHDPGPNLPRCQPVYGLQSQFGPRSLTADWSLGPGNSQTSGAQNAGQNVRRTSHRCLHRIRHRNAHRVLDWTLTCISTWILNCISTLTSTWILIPIRHWPSNLSSSSSSTLT